MGQHLKRNASKFVVVFIDGPHTGGDLRIAKGVGPSLHALSFTDMH